MHNLLFISDENYSLDGKLTKFLLSIGIPSHIKGYHFLREAVKLYAQNNSIKVLTKNLYYKVAQRFNTSACNVERSIRYALTAGYNSGKIENIDSLFGISLYANKKKPTANEFIALLADRLFLESLCVY